MSEAEMLVEDHSDATYPLPRGWKWMALGNIAEVVGGVTKGQQFRPKDVVVEVPYLRVANVQREHLQLDEILTIKTTQQKAKALKLMPGDLLLNEGGDRDKLGRGWIWNGEVPDCVHQNHVFRARIENGLPPKFVAYYTNSLGQAFFFAKAKQTTNLASISLSKIRQLPVPVPPNDVAEQIVTQLEARLSRLDKAASDLRKVESKLARHRAAVLAAATAGTLVPTEAELARREGRTYEPASVLLDRILVERRARWEAEQVAAFRAKGLKPRDDKWKAKYQPPVAPDTTGLPELPEGWTWASVDQLGEVSGGLTKNQNREKLPIRRPFLRVANVYANELRLADVHEIGISESEIERATLVKGDLLVVEGNGSPDQIGRVALWDGSIPDCVHQNHLIKVRSTVSVFMDWSVVFLSSHLGRELIQRVASTTSGLYTLSISKVASLPIPVPPLQEIPRILSVAKQHDDGASVIRGNVEKNGVRARSLRSAILQAAFQPPAVA